MEEKEYEFVHETIKKKPVNKKKLLRRTVLTAALAVVFGLVACVTFLLIEPVINNVLNPEKISKVEFPEEKKEVKPQELLTEESVARQEVQRQEAAVEEAKEEAIQSATTAFGIDQYEELYQDLYAYAQDSMDFMVSVIGISEMQDWLQGTFENENTTAGLILADNTAELLILADTGSMENANQYYVRFCDKQMTEAHIKQKDSQTGLTILAVSKDEIHSTTMEEIRIAELGISGDDAIVGQPVIAIGAPQGTYGSVSYGMITANKGRLNLTDASYNLLTTDLNTGTAPSGVLISLEGKVLGVMAGSVSGQPLTVFGISDIKTLIAKLSNNEKRAYFGIKGVDVTDDAHKEMNVPYGAYVTEVVSQSPAMRAGVSNGDIITKIGDHLISSYKEYRAVIMSLSPQNVVEMTVMRFDGTEYKEVILEITAEEAE